jgi:hypothetical protein
MNMSNPPSPCRALALPVGGNPFPVSNLKEGRKKKKIKLLVGETVFCCYLHTVGGGTSPTDG